MDEEVGENIMIKVEENVPSKENQLLLPKDQLPVAQCCRLCARGAKLVCDEQNPKLQFFPLFEGDNVLKKFDPSIPLNRLINKYLPIEILETDSLYPKVICSVCIEFVENTAEFFNTICEGQRLLAKILNRVDYKSKVLTFSENNPLKTAPKRRGRPSKKVLQETFDDEKKAFSEELKSNPEAASSDQTIVPEFSERRTKRQSRPPVRYADEVITAALKDQESINEDNKRNLENVGAMQYNPELYSQQHGPMDFDAQNILTANPDTDNNIDGVFVDHSNANNMDVDYNTRLDLHKIQKKQPTRRRKNAKRVVRRIQCEQCSKSFNHASSLIYHRLSVHDKTKNFICNICGRAFAHKQLLNNHLYVHADEKYFVCETCPAKFKSRASLYTHKKCRHSAVREHSCEVCAMQFSLKSSLVGHMRLHTGEKPFHCEFCEKKFAQRSSLREHRRTHTGEKPYHCSECSKSFTTASQLRSHKFCHQSDTVHLCQVCGKGFSHAENFKYHMRRHNSERPLQCPVCNKQFAESWTFKKHFRLHTGERPYECKICNKFFSDPSNFAKHKKLHVSETATTDGNLEGQSIEEYLIPENNGNDNGVEHLIEAGIDNASAEGTENFVEAGSSIVQILDPDMSFERDQDLGQVIYVYSGDGPLFTFTMADDQQTSVVQADDETIENVDVGTLNAALESFSPNDDIESHYYSLETIGDSTIAVPIQMPMSGQLNVSSNNRMLSGRVAIELDSMQLLSKPCDSESS